MAVEDTTTVHEDATYVQKACAYITRSERSSRAERESQNGRQLLVFEGPEHDGLQVPKGTIESGEDPHAAVLREIAEESGLRAVGATRHLTTDVWTRRHSPPKRYVRHFFHAAVHEPRDEWTHTVTGEGEEQGLEFEFSWVDLSASGDFALALDDYVHMLGESA